MSDTLKNDGDRDLRPTRTEYLKGVLDDFIHSTRTKVYGGIIVGMGLALGGIHTGRYVERQESQQKISDVLVINKYLADQLKLHIQTPYKSNRSDAELYEQTTEMVDVQSDDRILLKTMPRSRNTSIYDSSASSNTPRDL